MDRKTSVVAEENGRPRSFFDLPIWSQASELLPDKFLVVCKESYHQRLLCDSAVDVTNGCGIGLWWDSRTSYYPLIALLGLYCGTFDDWYAVYLSGLVQ